jgi:hypothetical protein
MSVMRALDPPEVIYTREGRKRATHEAYSYHITPYQNPPVKLEVVKGFIDKSGQFLAIAATAKAVDITPTEFRELISPTPQGKPAGDFRLSDVLGMVRRRNGSPPAPPSKALEASKDVEAKPEDAPQASPSETRPEDKAGSEEPAAVAAPADAG